jgi:hypothetical protein
VVTLVQRASLQWTPMVAMAVGRLLDSERLGQSLQVSPASAIAGDLVTIQICLQSTQDRAPAALEWDTDILSSQLELESEHMAWAPLHVKDVGESLACSPRRRADIQRSHCALAGGQRSIPSGCSVDSQDTGQSANRHGTYPLGTWPLALPAT